MGNTGDEAILGGLKLILHKIWPQSEIIVMGREKLLPIGIRSFLKTLIKPRLFLEPFKIIKSCDVFILGGGGLFTDEENPFVSFFWAFHGFMAQLLKKPVLCLGVSVGKMSFINKIFVKKVLSRAKIIMVRDFNSQKILAKMGIKSYLGCDFAILGCNVLTQSQAKNNNYIVISMRQFKNLDDRLYKILAQFCDAVIEKYGLAVKLIPFQKGEENDSKVLYKIFVQVRQKDKIKVEDFHENINELMQILANAQLVVAMRLHAGILAAIAGTPFIPLAYMNKVSDFWENFPEIKPIQFSEINIDDLLKRFQSIYSKEREHRDIAEKISINLREKAQKTEELLKKLVSK